MSYTYPTVNIGANSFPVYDTLEDANVYLVADISAQGWAHATQFVQTQALVSAVRWLETQNWQGQKADPTNTLNWPRSNIPWVNEDTIPDQVLYASFELAKALVDDPELRTNLWAPIASNVRAGSVSATFFRPYDVQVTSPLPKVVMSLVGQWLQGGAQPVLAKGDHERSPFDRPFDFDHGY